MKSVIPNSDYYDLIFLTKVATLLTKLCAIYSFVFCFRRLFHHLGYTFVVFTNYIKPACCFIYVVTMFLNTSSTLPPVVPCHISLCFPYVSFSHPFLFLLLDSHVFIFHHQLYQFLFYCYMLLPMSSLYSCSLCFFISLPLSVMLVSFKYLPPLSPITFMFLTLSSQVSGRKQVVHTMETSCGN